MSTDYLCYADRPRYIDCWDDPFGSAVVCSNANHLHNCDCCLADSGLSWSDGRCSLDVYICSIFHTAVIVLALLRSLLDPDGLERAVVDLIGAQAGTLGGAFDNGEIHLEKKMKMLRLFFYIFG